MITTTASVVIARPPEQVFEFLADARNEPRWLPGAENVRMISREPVGLDSVFEGAYARAGTVTVRVTRHDRPRLLTLAGEARMLSFTDEIVLERTGDGTALSATMTTAPKRLFRLMAPMMARVIGKQFQANWASLKATLEG